jgi:Cu(I)-responsive transcriptional regulator
MHIGEAAARSGVVAKTIRYYESVGLLAKAHRTPNGYRDYNDSDVETLRFVSRARTLGFSVQKVGELLSLYRDRKRASSDVRAIALSRIADIDRKVTELQAMRATLHQLTDSCHGDERPECPILVELSAPEPEADARR